MKIFVSHAKKDEYIAKALVDILLIAGIGYCNNDFFCTSIEGLGIDTSEDWREAIKTNLLCSDAVILLLTPHYKESEMCLNEMGVAWAFCDKVIPIVVEPLKYDAIGATFGVKQAVSLLDEYKLDDMRDKLLEWFPLENPTSRWNSKKDETIERISTYLISNSFPTALTRDELTKMESNLSELKKELKTLSNDNQEQQIYISKLEKAKDKEDIIAIKQEVGHLNDYDEFERLVAIVSDSLNALIPVVRTAVFNEFAKKELRYEYAYSNPALAEAEADGFIDENENCNHSHPLIKKVFKELSALKTFFDSELSESAYEKIQNDFPRIELEVDNLGFWREILDIKLEYNS